jgi:hypothetical protein
MVSDRVRAEIARIAGKLPDDDAEISEPVVAAWGDVRLGMDDADELLAAVELSDWVVDLMERHGEARGRALLRTYIRLLSVPGTMETLQMIRRNEVEQ